MTFFLLLKACVLKFPAHGFPRSSTSFALKPMLGKSRFRLGFYSTFGFSGFVDNIEDEAQQKRR